MKLQDLDARRPTDHIAKTLRSHMGDRMDFNRLSQDQAQALLHRTTGLLREWRGSVSRHYAERNPDYLRLIMVEQALKNVIEQAPAQAAGIGDVAKQAALQTAQVAQKKREIQDQIKEKQREISELQRAMNNPTMMAETNKKHGRRLSEASELQQAQVVLASQDMIDRVQGMMEDISEMQFKDLPALTDSVKNDMGVEQASQFQSQAAAALTNLLAAVQAGKTELESAQGVLTGQAPQVPGADQGMALAQPAAAPAGAEVDADLSLDANFPAEEPEAETPATSLGRERR